MTVETFQVQVLQVSDAAKQHLHKMLAQNPKALGIRFGVNKTGCNGYGYVLEFEETGQTEADQLVEVADIKFFIAREYLPMLAGISINVEQVGVNFQFKFANPNAKNQCGCGESFAY